MTFFYDLNKRLADLDKPKQQQLNEGVVAEKIEPPIKTNPAEKGKHSGKSIDQLKSQMASVKKQMAGYKERGEKVPDKLRGDFSELTFAIRAKQAHGGKWSSIKEGDVEEGNYFTGQLAKARAAGKKEADLDGDGDMEKIREAAKPDYIDLDKDGDRRESMKKAAADKKKKPVEEGWDDMMKDVERRREKKTGEVERGHKHDIEHTSTGRKVTRRVDDKGYSVGADDDEEKGSTEKRGRGRPKKTDKAPERITAKAYKHKGKRMEETMSEEDMLKVSYEPGERGEFDREGDMAKEQLHTIEQAAVELKSILKDEDNLPEWVQSKITKAMDYIDTARDYMLSQKDDQISEKAVSVAQRRAAGIAHAAQKGEIPKSELRGASKEMAKMPKGELTKFAKTKEKGLPKKKEESVDETTTSGSVATSHAAPKGKKSMTFGKGIYDSVNREVETLIAESMNVSMNMSSDAHGGPTKSLTVTATDEDAMKLAALLKMAGVGGGMQDTSDCGCGSTPCSCEEQVEEAYGDTDASENQPDWPTAREGSDNALQYSGGLNKPKVTGQTTVPVTGVQPAQSPVMYEDEDISRMMEMAGLQQDQLKPWERTMKETAEESVEEGEYKAGPDKSQIPAVMRKGKQGMMSLKDLEKERTASPTTPEGLKALQQKLGITSRKPEQMEESLMKELARFKGK